MSQKNKITPAQLRGTVLKMVYSKSSGHIGASFSIAEIITVLYNLYDIPDTDKLILSKGHAVPIIYAALYHLGRLSLKDLVTFRECDSKLQGHPDKLLMPELTATTGSLGQGLSIAIGHAIAMRKLGKPGKVFCILGDGEMQEGQVWEALMSVPSFDIPNLTVILDRNYAQNEGETIFNQTYYSIPSFLSRSWRFKQIEGNNLKDVEDTFTPKTSSKPTFITANTKKAAGISFMEGKPEWHGKVPTLEELSMGLKELGVI